MRASVGEDLVGPVRIRSGVPLTRINGAGPAPCALQPERRAHGKLDSQLSKTS
jgi:hypothetical protein